MWHGLEGIGWGWIVLTLLQMVLFSILCIAVLVAVYRRSSDSESRILEILKTRYAKGELSHDQFERLKRELIGPESMS